MTKLLKYLNKTAKEKEKLMKTSSKERDHSIKTASDKEYYFNKKNNELEEAKTARNQIEEGNMRKQDRQNFFTNFQKTSFGSWNSNRLDDKRTNGRTDERSLG